MWNGKVLSQPYDEKPTTRTISNNMYKYMENFMPHVNHVKKIYVAIWVV